MQNEYNFEVNTSNHLIDYGPPSQAVQSPLVGGHGDDIGQPLGGKENLRRATAAPKHQAPSTKHQAEMRDLRNAVSNTTVPMFNC